VGISVRGSRLSLSGANWTAQRNGEASIAAFSMFNASAQVYINLL